MKTVIGITGKIGAGKTSIVQQFAKIPNVHIYDCDKVVTELYKDVSVKEELLSKFGTSDKTDLGEIVLIDQDTKNLQVLSDIFSPFIKAHLIGWLHHKTGVILLDAPTLFETKLDMFCDVTIQINASRTTRSDRLQNRTLKTSEIFNIIDVFQMSELERSELADFSYNNDTSKTSTTFEQISQKISQYLPTIAMYAGSFDPVTHGHLDIIKQASNIFGQVYVAVGTNETKKCLLSIDDRIQLIEHELEQHNIQNIKVISFTGLLVTTANQFGVTYIVRGMRDITDATLELSMAGINFTLDSSMRTIAIPTHPEYINVSSSAAKVVLKANNDVDISWIVSDNVRNKMIEVFNK